ncbi:MAG: low molecular weight phosphotyrosine protein phosphatase [Tabrizicola sp.]
MFGSVLVVCVGNICRSPVGERVLAKHLTERGANLRIGSAGLNALVGESADRTASIVAAARGVSLEGHRARQFSRDLAGSHDLILVMEPWHRHEILIMAPELSGRVMLFDQWMTREGIPDPYRRSREFHEAVFDRIDASAARWAEKLSPRLQG